MVLELRPGRYVRRFADVPSPTDRFSSQRIGTFESAYFYKSYVPAGFEASTGFHTHGVHQVYFVLQGELSVHIGSEIVTGKKHELIIIPKGIPHKNFNPGTEDEMHLEIMLPGPIRNEDIFSKAEQSNEKPPPNLVRREDPAKVRIGRNPKYQTNILADKSLDFDGGHIRIDHMLAGGSGPGLHIHRFDQFYFVLEGVLSVEVAGERHEVHPNELAIMSQGVVHRQWNEGKEDVKSVTMCFPEEPRTVRWDAPVTAFSGDFSYIPEPGREG